MQEGLQQFWSYHHCWPHCHRLWCLSSFYGCGDCCQVQSSKVLQVTNMFLLTLSYSSEGSPALAGVKTLLTQNCLKLTIPGFLYNLLPVSCGDIGFKKNPRSSIDLESKSAFTAFRELLPSANYLVGCDSPLQRVMTVWRTFSLI